MSTGVELLREHKYRELWEKYCGFIDLSTQEFMLIQEHLLMEQMELLKACELGKHVMRGAMPRTLEEFREQVPLTTYADYVPYLSEQREDALPAKPVLWQRTSGISGEYEHKWAPMTARMYQEIGSVLFGTLILATSDRRYDVSVGDNEKVLHAVAPPPFATGHWARSAAQELPIRFLPALEEAEAMSFEDRLAKGVRQGLDQGIDLVFGMPSVLVALGEQIGRRQPSRGRKSLSMLAQPRLLMRMAKGLLKSKLAGRSLFPKDLWNLRGVVIGGSGCSLYRQRIKELWGKDPLEAYACTEGLIIALQTWDRDGMIFPPHLNFVEFLSEEERIKAIEDPDYQPKTCLINEVALGQSYELVITNLLGGAFVRYRMGDMVRFIALRNEKLKINLPQMVFYSRADSFIDMAGFTRITERVIGQALQQAGVPSHDWTARKEGADKPVLHLYLELEEDRRGGTTPAEMREAIHQQLKDLDGPYRDLEVMLGLRPLEVTILPTGSFRRYAEEQRVAGAGRAGSRPPRINTTDAVLETLLGAPSEPDRVPVA